MPTVTIPVSKAFDLADGLPEGEEIPLAEVVSRLSSFIGGVLYGTIRSETAIQPGDPAHILNDKVTAQVNVEIITERVAALADAIDALCPIEITLDFEEVGF